mgnify:CR=1 FL=1
MAQWEQAGAILIDDPKRFLMHFDAPSLERHESEPVTRDSPIPLAKFDWAFLMPAHGKSDMVQLLNIAKDESGMPNLGFRMLCNNARWVWDIKDLHAVMKVPVVDGVPFPIGPFAGLDQAVHQYKLVSPRVAIEDTDWFPRIKEALVRARAEAGRRPRLRERAVHSD